MCYPVAVGWTCVFRTGRRKLYQHHGQFQQTHLLKQRRALAADWLISLANLIPDQMTKLLNPGTTAS